MKSLTLIALTLALGVCQAAIIETETLAGNDRSVSSIITDKLEAMKVQMADGFPRFGIPPMAPLKVSHRDLNYETGEMRIMGQVDDVVINGLNEFEIRVMDYSAILSRIKYEFNFASLNLTTQYEADVGAGYHMERKGGAFMALEDLNIAGFIKYSTGLLPSSSFRVKQIDVRVKVGKVVSKIENLSKYRIFNRKLNEVIEEFISLTINDNTELLASWIDSAVTPMCNDLIGDRSLKDLIALITGGGSN